MRAIGAVPLAVSVAEFKAAVHYTADTDADDAPLEFVLVAAQALVERATNRPIGAREVELVERVLPCAAGVRWYLPCMPVSALSGLSYDAGDGPVEIDPASVKLVWGGHEPQIELAGDVLPIDGRMVRLTAQATVGEDATSAAVRPLLQAIMLIAREWSDAGISIGPEGGGVEVVRLSFGARAIIGGQKYKRPAVVLGLD